MVLTLLSVPLTIQEMTDFSVSHLLAGLTMGAYLFCATSATALACWVPHILAHSLDVTPKIHWQQIAKRLSAELVAVQILAVSCPMLAVTLLVNVHQRTSTFAIGILSVVALAGLVLLVFCSRLINRSLKVLVRMDVNDNRDD